MENKSKKDNLVFLNSDSDAILNICTELLNEAKSGKVGDLMLIYFNNTSIQEPCKCGKDECGNKETVTVYWSVKNIIKMVGIMEKTKIDILNQSAYEDYMEEESE